MTLKEIIIGLIVIAVTSFIAAAVEEYFKMRQYRQPRKGSMTSYKKYCHVNHIPVRK